MNYYTISIEGKNPRRLLVKILNNHINCSNIKYEIRRITLNVSYEDYLKIQKLNTIYKITIIKINGKKRIKNIFKHYNIFIVFTFLSFLTIILLSNIIFKIKVLHEKEEMRNLVIKELKKEKITLFTFKKNYKELKEISERIKENNKNKIEWIEISSNGISYEVKVIERISKDKKQEENDVVDIVASKNGMIMDMYVSSGEIKKNKGDYVAKGEVIVSGIITRNDNIVGSVKSKADVYAEVWYKVKLNSDLKQKILIKQQENTKKLVLTIFNKDIILFKKDTKSKVKETTIFKGIFTKLSFKTEEKYKKQDKTYNKDELKNILETKALETIKSSLKENEKILMQKTLKTSIKNGKMNLEVFFKVYQNIALEKESEIPESDNQKEVR